MLTSLLLLAASLAMGGDAPSITVRCDPRVELFCVVFRLADDPQFNSDAAESPYADAVDEWFAGVRGHAAVGLARELRRSHSISFNAIPDLAVHCDAVKSLEPLMPLDPLPARLDKRWTKDAAEPFLAAMRTFVVDSKFEEFFAAQAPRYAETEKRLAALLADAKIEPWVHAFFGQNSADLTFTVIPSLLNGGNNYGCGVAYPDGRLALSPVMGIWQWDADGNGVFGPEHVPTVVHEFTHNFANPVIDRHVDAFEASGRAVFKSVQKTMEMQAYATWQIMLYESLVRACVNRYVLEHQGEAAAAQDAAYNAKRGFTWTADLSALLARYEADRAQYANLDAFAPELVAFFDDVASRTNKVAAAAPKVVSIVPANGATDVDPATTQIVITFDRRMSDGMSVVGGASPRHALPTTTSPPRWDDSRRELTWSVKLEPGKAYRFGLNGGNHMNFRSADGTPLEPVIVEFTTRPR